MHLTNYSVNKRNKSKYDEGDSSGEKGTKRSLKYLFDYLNRNNIDASKIWTKIQVKKEEENKINIKEKTNI